MTIPKVIPTSSRFSCIRTMAAMGYMVGPASPMKKQTYYPWSTIAKESYNFNAVWKGQPTNSNVFILCGEDAAVVDLDSHSCGPNGRTLFDNLDPSVYEGCIVTESQSRGIHIWYHGVNWQNLKYSWLPGFDYYHYTLNDAAGWGMFENVVVRAGKCVCFEYPSVTPKGEYRYLSERTHLNTKPSELPPLHQLWQYCFPYPEIEKAYENNTRKVEKLTPRQIRLQIDAILNTRYKVKSGFRHHMVLSVASELLSLGLSKDHVIQLTQQYLESNVKDREIAPNEAKDCVEWVMKQEHQGKNYIRWKFIKKQEREIAYNSINKIFGGV